MHFVARGHFWSCDKDAGHTIRSAIAQNLMLHANFMSLCFIVPELLPIIVYIMEIQIFDLFCSCDLDLMTFIYELDLYFPKIYWICKYELPVSRLSKVIV